MENCISCGNKKKCHRGQMASSLCLFFHALGRGETTRAGKLNPRKTNCPQPLWLSAPPSAGRGSSPSLLSQAPALVFSLLHLLTFPSLVPPSPVGCENSIRNSSRSWVSAGSSFLLWILHTLHKKRFLQKGMGRTCSAQSWEGG